MSEENAASEPSKPLLRIYDGGDGRSLELENVEPWETPVHGAGLLDWMHDLIKKWHFGCCTPTRIDCGE